MYSEKDIQKALRAVSYLRYSDHKQDGGTSIETQKEHCDKYAEDHKMIHLADYIDEAKSASKKTVSRESFLRLLEDAKKGMFDVVLIFKFSRVFRNQYEAHYYEHELEKHGVKLISVTEPIDDSIEGKLMKGVIHAFNEFTSATISAHVSSSMHTLAKKGYFLGSVSLFGYDAVHDGKEGRRYQINEEEAKIVRDLFSMFSDGYSLGDIARTFSRRGYKTRKYKKRGGKPFGENTLRDMLLNSHYLGIYSYKSKEFPPIVIPDNHPAIIDEKTWLIVQARLQESVARQPKRRSNVKRTYYLSGKIECGYCGSNCTGSASRWTYKGKTTLRPYYHCNDRRQGRGDCPAKTIRKDEIEACVFQKIREEILNDEKIHEIAKHIFSITGEEVINPDLEDLREQESELMEMLSEAMDATMNMKLSKTARQMWQKKTENISDDLERVSNALRRAELNESNKISIESIEEHLKAILEQWNASEDQVEIQKLIVDKFVDKIVVTNEDIEIFLNVLHDSSSLNMSTGFPVWTLRAELKKTDIKGLR